MKPLAILLLLAISAILNVAVAQSLEAISPSILERSHAITFQDKAYIVQTNSTHLSSYNGRNIVQFNFPRRDGRNLVYVSWNNDMVILGSSFYLILEFGSVSRERFLYRFDGSSFYAISLPGNVMSNPVFYKGKIYVLVETTAGVKLFSYDGVGSREIPSSGIPATHTYHLIVEDQYLYTIGNGYYTYEPYSVKRFDGSNFITLPYFEFFASINDIKAIPGTEEIYINVGDFRILHFDGRLLREIYNERGYYFTFFEVWNNVLYFPENRDNLIYRYDGRVLSELALPEGAQPIAYSNTVLFQNKLLIPAELPDGSHWMYEYNGSTFVRNFEFPERLTHPRAFVKDDRYIIITRPLNGPVAFEYNGSVYTEITAPAEKKLTSFLTSTPCFDLWNIAYYNGHEHVYEIAKADKGCPRAVIPEGLRDYDGVSIGITGKYRDWCWTDLLIDWEIVPICPIPEICSGPRFKVSLIDMQGKEFWNKDFEKPFDIKFPIDDIPYTLTVSSITDKDTQSILIVGHDLVSKGLSGINISMLPQKDYFFLEAQTDKGDVPFMMSLLNKEGKTVWESNFTAPLQKEITATVSEPGVTLRFSSIPSDQKQLEDYGITKVAFYPNPYKGRLSVDIETKGAKVPAEIRVTNLQGESVWEKQVTAPIHLPIEMPGYKPGLYILTLTVGDVRISEQIKLDN